MVIINTCNCIETISNPVHIDPNKTGLFAHHVWGHHRKTFES